MQEILCHIEGKRVALTRGIHQALTYFRCLVEDRSKLPTRLNELVPLQTMLDGYHEASGYMCGGGVLPGSTDLTRTPQLQPSAADTSMVLTGAHLTQMVSWGA